MSSPPTSAGLPTILERLASQLGSLEARLTALEAGKVPTSSAHVRTTHTNVPDDFHPTTTKRKGKAKAKAKAIAPPKAAPAPSTPSVAKHSPHCPYQARTFPMEDKPDRHLIMVVVPTDAAACYDHFILFLLFFTRTFTFLLTLGLDVALCLSSFCFTVTYTAATQLHVLLLKPHAASTQPYT